MSDKPKGPPKGMESLKVNVPQDTAEWFRSKAAREGVSQQSVLAPVLNAYARGEIKGGFAFEPAPHGNARRKD